MPLTPGTRLGHYNVTSLLGEGGMGQVWQATDTQLNRQVALKILPDAFADDPDRLARFTREAQILASLNHPNIAAIHGIEEAEGTRALVLELVEGPTLADRIAKGPIPLDEALPIAKQIAEALEAAHEAGVIHRDLKPANIKVREDGTVKVLDFGLAKALDPNPEGDPSQSPTLTAAATRMGVIMGTAAYMSPEQARGKPADRRADIWAFGCVLYEMLTGTRPFGGGNVSEVLAEVIKSEPIWEALPDATPATLRQVVRRCLQKNPKQRLHDVADLRLAMEGAFETPVQQPADVEPAPPLRVWQRPIPAVVGLLAAVLLTGFAMWAGTRRDVTPNGLLRFVMAPSESAPLGFSGGRQDLAIAPDGTHVVYSGSDATGTTTQLNLWPLDQFVGGPLPGSEGGLNPFFSPDGQSVGFVSDRSGQTLQKISIAGGPPVTLTELPSGIRGASWGTDDRIIFGTSDAGLFRVSAGGGEPEALTQLAIELGESSHGWPFIIPGHDAVLFVSLASLPARTSAQLAVLDLETREVTRLQVAGMNPRYVSTGHLVYAVAGGSVRAVPFDVSSLKVSGAPVTLLEDVAQKSSGANNFSISDTGTLVYALRDAVNIQRTLVWVNRGGREEPFDEDNDWPPDQYLYPRFSPDGSRVAVVIAEDADNVDNGNADMWVLDRANGSRTLITHSGFNRWFPVWSPSGLQVAFAAGGGSTNHLALAPADGSGQIEPLSDRGTREFPTSWTPAGNVLAIHVQTPGSGRRRDLATIPMDSDRTPVPFLATEANERGGVFSPNGHWLAYVSDESGRDEVYVLPYPGPGRKHTISTNGGSEPAWAPTGGELFFRHEDEVWVVGVDTAGTLQPAAPVPLFAGAYVPDNSGGGRSVANYDVAPDGQRFLMLKAEGEFGSRTRQIHVVDNWFEELKARVPIP